MTLRARVRAAIDRRPADRPPYCIGFTAEGREELLRGLRRGVAAGPHVQAALEHFDPDQLDDVDPVDLVDAIVDNDVVRIGPPWWQWHGLQADWGGMAPPTSPARVLGRGSYEGFFEEVKRRRDEDDRYVLATIYGSHFEKANFARGIENFLADLGGEPAFARRLLRRIIDRNLVMLDNILPCADIDGVLLGSDWGTQLDLIMAPATWQELIRPGEQEEYDLIRSFGKDVWIHSCGNVLKIIPSLIEMGVDVLNPVQPEAMDLTFLKETYGDRLAWWGGLSTQQTLPFGTPEEVQVEARRVRALLSRGGGCIFAPAQEIQGDVPAENILALLEVAREPAGTR
ncbi:MAG: uroporphyrinogen decarboxylase family protein [Gemmatimonadota bacterium]